MIRKQVIGATGGALIVLLTGLFGVSAQQRVPDLKDKQITIQMTNRPVVIVFARLIYKYDIAIGFEESILDGDHDHYFFETNIPPDDFKAQYSGDKEFLTDRGNFSEDLITLNFKDARLEDVMNSVVKQMRNYDWEIKDDVVNIFPVRGRDPRFKKLMDLRIREFAVGKQTEVSVIQPLLFRLPEFKKFLEENNLHVDFERYAPVFDNRPLPADMKFGDLTFKELLNAITKSKRGGWILQKKKQNKIEGKELIDILI